MVLAVRSPNTLNWGLRSELMDVALAAKHRRYPDRILC